MRSRTYLGAQYRRLRTKLGAPKAIEVGLDMSRWKTEAHFSWWDNKKKLHKIGYFRELMASHRDINEGLRSLLRLCRETAVRLGKNRKCAGAIPTASRLAAPRNLDSMRSGPQAAKEI
jgi:hypothetical protein